MHKFYRKFTGILSLVIIFSAILNGCGTVDNLEFYDDTESTSLSEEVNTISIGSKEDRLRQVFGEPISVEKPDESNSKYLEYDDIEFEIKDGEVVRYFYSNKKYITQKGIKLGSSKEDVIDVYGENYYEREDTGTEIIGYFDKTKKVNIEFAFSDDLDLVMVSKIDWKGYEADPGFQKLP